MSSKNISRFLKTIFCISLFPSQPDGGRAELLLRSPSPPPCRNLWCWQGCRLSGATKYLLKVAIWVLKVHLNALFVISHQIDMLAGWQPLCWMPQPDCPPHSFKFNSIQFLLNLMFLKWKVGSLCVGCLSLLAPLTAWLTERYGARQVPQNREMQYL